MCPCSASARLGPAPAEMILDSALSELPFQAEELRHCPLAILNLGEENNHPTHGEGWKSDTMAALEATCCSIRALGDSRYDMDPRVSSNNPVPGGA